MLGILQGLFAEMGSKVGVWRPPTVNSHFLYIGGCFGIPALPFNAWRRCTEICQQRRRRCRVGSEEESQGQNQRLNSRLLFLSLNQGTFLPVLEKEGSCGLCTCSGKCPHCPAAELHPTTLPEQLRGMYSTETSIHMSGQCYREQTATELRFNICSNSWERPGRNPALGKAEESKRKGKSSTFPLCCCQPTPMGTAILGEHRLMCEMPPASENNLSKQENGGGCVYE